jgi:hypothetical protein
MLVWTNHVNSENDITTKTTRDAYFIIRQFNSSNNINYLPVMGTKIDKEFWLNILKKNGYLEYLHLCRNRLRVFENRVLRRIFGRKRDEETGPSGL